MGFPYSRLHLPHTIPIVPLCRPPSPGHHCSLLLSLPLSSPFSPLEHLCPPSRTHPWPHHTILHPKTLPLPNPAQQARSITGQRSPALCIHTLRLSAGTMNNEKLRGDGTRPAQTRLSDHLLPGSNKSLVSPHGTDCSSSWWGGLQLPPQPGRKVQGLLDKTAVRLYVAKTKTIFYSNLILRNRWTIWAETFQRKSASGWHPAKDISARTV